MPLVTPLLHEKPTNSSSLSAPSTETPPSDDSSNAVSQALDSVTTKADVSSSAAQTTKSQVKEAAEKVFEQQERKEREGESG